MVNRRLKAGLLIVLGSACVAALAIGKSLVPTRPMALCGVVDNVEVWSEGCRPSYDGKIHVAEGSRVLMIVRDRR